MNWIELISAVGIGAIVTKILDAIWLTRITQRIAHSNWLRDQRLAAYTTAAADFLSFGLTRPAPNDPFTAYAKLAPALLLADNEQLASDIDQFVSDLDRLHRLQGDSSKEQEAKDLYDQLVERSRLLVKSMRQSLTNYD